MPRVALLLVGLLTHYSTSAPFLTPQPSLYSNFDCIFPTLPSENATARIGEYFSLEQTERFLRQVPNRTADNAQLVTVGRSEEGRDILGVQFGNDSSLPFIVIDAGIHAREWSSIHTALYLIDKLVQSLDTHNAAVLNWLKHYNLVIIPVLNPDGFDFTWYLDDEPLTHRLWRKNRSRSKCPNQTKCCSGIDLNRNWDIAFEEESTVDPCSDVFPGEKPFSALETRTYSTWLRSLPKLAIYFTLHSHGQLWLYPYAFASRTYPQNIERAMLVAQKAVDAIHAHSNTKYSHGTPADKLYKSAGSAMDWVQQNLNPEFSYTIEIRPTTKETYGFILEQNELIPAGEEIWIGMSVVVNEAIEFELHPYIYTGSTPKPEEKPAVTLEQRDSIAETFDDDWLRWINS